MLLKDRIIFLTGGSSGIGRECALTYAREGAVVVVAALDDDDLRKTADELGAPHTGSPCDVTNAHQVATAIRKTLEQHGRLDAIHNNVGVPGPSVPLERTTDDDWRSLFNVNVRSILYTTRHGIDALRQSRGCILNTSSIVGSIGQSAHAAYVATKGAVNALTLAMALDYASQGVRVNAVCPGGVWTPMLREWAANQADPSSIASYLDQIHPLGKCPEGDVVADACVFLLSNQARFVTGHLMHVTGGAELGYRRPS